MIKNSLFFLAVVFLCSAGKQQHIAFPFFVVVDNCTDCDAGENRIIVSRIGHFVQETEIGKIREKLNLGGRIHLLCSLVHQSELQVFKTMRKRPDL